MTETFGHVRTGFLDSKVPDRIVKAVRSVLGEIEVGIAWCGFAEDGSVNSVVVPLRRCLVFVEQSQLGASVTFVGWHSVVSVAAKKDWVHVVVAAPGPHTFKAGSEDAATHVAAQIVGFLPT